MGTRSLTHVYETADAPKPLVTIYRQYDGCPDGIGNDIKNILGHRKLVNGYNDPEKQCNGMGCAAAMLIGGLKDGKCGNVYIQEPGAKDCGEEYTYSLYSDGDGFRLVIDDGSALYDGSLADFDAEKLNAEA